MHLAEDIGYFRGEFGFLKTERCGFDPQIRFILDRDLEGARDAADLKLAVLEGTKRMWRLKYDSTAPLMDEQWQIFFEKHQVIHSPDVPTNESLIRGENFDSKLSFSFFPVFSEYGSDRDRQWSSDNVWGSWTMVQGRRVEVQFEKSNPPEYEASGAFVVPDFERAVPLAYPFFFSGGPHFYYSKAHRLTPQLECFFAVYRRVLPRVWNALEASIAACNRYLDSLG